MTESSIEKHRLIEAKTPSGVLDIKSYIEALRWADQQASTDEAFILWHELVQRRNIATEQFANLRQLQGIDTSLIDDAAIREHLRIASEQLGRQYEQEVSESYDYIRQTVLSRQGLYGAMTADAAFDPFADVTVESEEGHGSRYIFLGASGEMYRQGIGLRLAVDTTKLEQLSQSAAVLRYREAFGI